MTINICPLCNKDMSDIKAKDEIIRLIKESGLKWLGEYVNPGGREFIFEGRKRIQISDYCYHCDLKTVKEALDKLK